MVKIGLSHFFVTENIDRFDRNTFREAMVGLGGSWNVYCTTYYCSRCSLNRGNTFLHYRLTVGELLFSDTCDRWPGINFFFAATTAVCALDHCSPLTTTRWTNTRKKEQTGFFFYCSNYHYMRARLHIYINSRTGLALYILQLLFHKEDYDGGAATSFCRFAIIAIISSFYGFCTKRHVFRSFSCPVPIIMDPNWHRNFIFLSFCLKIEWKKTARHYSSPSKRQYSYPRSLQPVS